MTGGFLMTITFIAWWHRLTGFRAYRRGLATRGCAIDTRKSIGPSTLISRVGRVSPASAPEYNQRVVQRFG